MARQISVIAIIAAFNEADVIGETIEDLVRQDVGVFLIDDGSTDATVDAASAYLGQGLVGIERRPPSETYDWRGLLRRKQALARELGADWIIHHDADEFRESLWPELSLREAIARVDALGYNAIDFALFNFWPTASSPGRTGGVRERLTFCSEGDAYDRRQVRCWRQGEAEVDLASSGGHDVAFDGRRVFPLRFILRHYPLRSADHSRRKIVEERRPRFSSAERAAGWHVQYDDYTDPAATVRDEGSLERYDPIDVRVRLCLRHRGVETLEHDLDGRLSAVLALERQVTALESTLRSVKSDLETREAMVSQLQGDYRHAADEGAQRAAEVQRLIAALEATTAEGREAAAQAAAVRLELERVYDSKSWRWTAGARRLGGLIRGPAPARSTRRR
jgi:glycosyltransferase involved in cell wall biosynthesis